MTTPKSPEEIINSAQMFIMEDDSGLGINEKFYALPEYWLRSSMASLLLHMAERVEPEPRELLPAEEVKINTFLKGYNSACADMRTLLTNEARKITNNE